MADPVVPRAVSRLLFALVLVSCAYFVQGAGPNQNSRYALIRALVEDRTVQIDPYRTTTHDISKAGDHWYCDKAPGISLAAALAYALGVRLVQPNATEPDGFAIHLLTLATCSLATAFAAVLLLHFLVGLGLGLRASLMAVIAWVLGTNAFAYATLFLAHQFVASLFVIALFCVRAAAQRPGSRWVFGAGLAAAFAVISEFPTALIAAPLGVYALATLGLRRMPMFALGAVLPAIALAVYNTVCFGGPLSLGYQTLAVQYFAEGVRGGFLGFGPPNLAVAAELTLYEYRGLLPLSPFLVLAVPGAVWMLRDRERRGLGVLCVVAFGAMLTVISGFPFWNGGAAMGPRHLVPALPFLIIPVGVAIDELLRRAPRTLIPILAVIGVSIAICTACVAVQPEFFDVPARQPPAPEIGIPAREHPISQLVFPLLANGYISTKATWSGRLSYVMWTQGREDDAYNLGELVGLPGPSSLIPLIAIWTLLGLAIARRAERSV